MDVEKYDDLLGRMLAANDKQEKPKFSMDEVIGECSSFFLAGHEATCCGEQDPSCSREDHLGQSRL